MSAKNYRIIHQKSLPHTQFKQESWQINDKYMVHMGIEPDMINHMIELDQSKPKYNVLEQIMKGKHRHTQPPPPPPQSEQSPIKSPIVEVIQPEEPKQVTFEPVPIAKISPKKFRESLYIDDRINQVPKKMIDNPILNDIVTNTDLILKKDELVPQVQSLKRLQLLKEYKFNHNPQAGIGKLPFIMNDFHTKSTNNGFSRNKQGNFFTR